MSDFDPNRKLVMASFKTVHGHGLGAGAALTVVDVAHKPGHVEPAMARRLFNAGIAVYAEDFRPTPVMAKQQESEQETLALVAGQDDEAVKIDNPPEDLVIWPQDDDETGKKAGAKVTRDDLFVIAARECAEVESDDNKASLITKITLARAARAAATDAAAPAVPPIVE